MDAVVTISLEQLQDLTDENSNSLSLSITKSNTTSIDVIINRCYSGSHCYRWNSNR